MNKKTLILAIILILVVSSLGITLLPGNSSAANSVDLPEQAGLYDVPGHSNLKLRVFVHATHSNGFVKPNGGKPSPQTPTESCASTEITDPDSLAVVPGAGWKLPANWAYSLNLSSVPTTVGANNLVTISSNAFQVWKNSSAKVQQAVNIYKGPNTTVNKAQLDGQNIIAWGRTSGTALATSYIWYDKITGIATEVDTIMNNKFTWYWSNPGNWSASQTCAYTGVYDAQNILTHELGHTMGLDDVYTGGFINNTMYGYGSKSETKKDTLTTGDKDGVSSLY